MRRLPVCALAAASLAAAAALAQDTPPTDQTVAASNLAVIHDVDTKLLAARLREADRKALSGDAKGAAADLAELLSRDTSPLVEEGENAYLCVLEAALQRVAALPSEAIAAYRAAADARAADALDRALRSRDAAALARSALPSALTSYGPRMLVALADLRASRGDADLAAQALADCLRLWPATGPLGQMPGVDRGAVVARLAALHASRGDEAAIRALLRETPSALLDAPSPRDAAAKLRDDLGACIRTAAAARRARLPEGPDAPLEIVAEHAFSERPDVADSPRSRVVDEEPLSVGTPERPVLLTREPVAASGRSRVVALGRTDGRDLGVLWTWPPVDEIQADIRRNGHGRFLPARHGDLVIFPWPAAPTARREPAVDFQNDDDRCSLVVLSLSAEGKLVDERGMAETGREDADRELEALSFAGRPLVVGDAVYTTLIRRLASSAATELHVARFDLVPFGDGHRLIERWRRHVLDGTVMPPVRFAAAYTNSELQERLEQPEPMAESCGRLYVCGNTGALACLDGTSGRALWVKAYPRFGPPIRHTVSDARQVTWQDVPVLADGGFVWAAPRDADYFFQFRAMPRGARSTLVEAWRFHGGGTSSEPGAVFANLVPDQVLGVFDGVGWFAGRIPTPRPDALFAVASPLASLRMREAGPGEPRRPYAYSQVPEMPPAGAACVGRDALYFPGAKAIYRVAVDAFESSPLMLWKATSGAGGDASRDEIGNLLADGPWLWSVTPRRVVLFGKAKK
jgi:hypothetical protein